MDSLIRMLIRTRDFISQGTCQCREYSDTPEGACPLCCILYDLDMYIEGKEDLRVWALVSLYNHNLDEIELSSNKDHLQRAYDEWAKDYVEDWEDADKDERTELVDHYISGDPELYLQLFSLEIDTDDH